KPTGMLVQHIPDGTVWFWDDIEPSPTGNDVLYRGLPPAGATDLGFKSTTGLTSGIERTAQEARKAKGEGKKVIFFSHNAGESERLQELLEEHLGSQGTEGMEFLVGPLRSGFFSKDLFVATNAEIFGRYRHRPRAPKFKGGGVVREIQDVRPGDYVVHE